LTNAIAAAADTASLWLTDPSFTPTAADVASASQRLTSAEAELVSLQPLTAAIAQAKALVEADYSATSWQRLQLTITTMEAELALWSSDATAEVSTADVAEVTEILTESRNDLVLLSESGISITSGGEPLVDGETIAAGSQLTFS